MQVRDLGAAALALATLCFAGCVDREGLVPGGDPMAGSGGSIGGGGSGTGTGGGAMGGAPMPGTGGRTQPGTGGGAMGGAPMPGTGGRTQPGTGGGAAGGALGTGGRAQPGTGGAPVCGPVCAIYCPHGHVLDANGCPTCACNPAPGACTTAECGTPPPVGGTPIICPAPPAAGAGAEAPAIVAAGPVCRRNAGGKCVWEAGGTCGCPGVKCDLACPNGFQTGPDGCAICACIPSVTCTADSCGPRPTDTLVCSSRGSSGGGGAAGIAAPTADRVGLVCRADPTTNTCRWLVPTGCKLCPPVSCPIGACPGGFRTGADGCQLCECSPPPTPACAGYADYMTCVADAACRWLQPGCGEPALAAAGCYARSTIGCGADTDCAAGRQCLKRVINPCALPPNSPPDVVTCGACGQTLSLCQ
jgi:hypothetical protein